MLVPLKVASLPPHWPRYTYSVMKEPLARFWQNQFVPFGVLLGAAFIIVGIIASWTAFSIKSANNTISVTGSATEAATADSAKWVVTVTRSTINGFIPQATDQELVDVHQTVAFFEKAGIAADNITVGAVHTDQSYAYYKTNLGTPPQYIVSQQITVISNNPQLIAKLAQNTSALTNQGITLAANDPEYYISTLPAIRISLMGAAIDTHG